MSSGNPLELGLVRNAAIYPWSSAAVHIAGRSMYGVLQLDWNSLPRYGGETGWRGLIETHQICARDRIFAAAPTPGDPLGQPLSYNDGSSLRHGPCAPLRFYPPDTCRSDSIAEAITCSFGNTGLRWFARGFQRLKHLYKLSYLASLNSLLAVLRLGNIHLRRQTLTRMGFQ